MECIRENVMNKDKRCVFPPYIQSQLNKGVVLCKYHAMDELVNYAHKNKISIGKRFITEGGGNG